MQLFSPLRSLLLTLILTVALLFSSPAWAQWGTSDLPTIGSPAPAINLPDNSGNQRTLQDFRGSWIVLYFYPKDFTSGCTIEARRFQQDLDKFQAINAQVIGISADTVDSHQKFCTAEGLKFPLLADVEGTVSQAYGSWLGTMALRNTFIIDPQGILREVFPIVHPTQHSIEVLAKLAALQQS